MTRVGPTRRAAPSAPRAASRSTCRNSRAELEGPDRVPLRLGSWTISPSTWDDVLHGAATDGATSRPAARWSFCPGAGESRGARGRSPAWHCRRDPCGRGPAASTTATSAACGAGLVDRGRISGAFAGACGTTAGCATLLCCSLSRFYRQRRQMPILGPEDAKSSIRARVLVVLAGGGQTPLPCSHRPRKPAVPFAGRYRIIDIVLSNFVNSPPASRC